MDSRFIPASSLEAVCCNDPTRTVYFPPVANLRQCRRSEETILNHSNNRISNPALIKRIITRLISIAHLAMVTIKSLKFHLRPPPSRHPPLLLVHRLRRLPTRRNEPHNLRLHSAPDAPVHWLDIGRATAVAIEMKLVLTAL